MHLSPRGVEGVEMKIRSISGSLKVQNRNETVGELLCKGRPTDRFGERQPDKATTTLNRATEVRRRSRGSKRLVGDI